MEANIGDAMPIQRIEMDRRVSARAGPTLESVRNQPPPPTTTDAGLTWYQIEAERTQQEEVETVIVVLEHGCVVN
jgi:hypothetical protein